MKPQIRKFLSAAAFAFFACSFSVFAQNPVNDTVSLVPHRTPPPPPAPKTVTEGSMGKFVNYPDYTFSVTPNVGALLFYGDIRQYSVYPSFKNRNELNLGYGVSASDWILPFAGLQLNLLGGNLSGVKRSDQSNWLHNPYSVYFEGYMFEASLTARINIMPLIQNKPGKYDVIVYAGAGTVMYRSLLYQLSSESVIDGVGYSNPSTKTTGSMVSALTIPMGVAFNYNFNPHISAGIDIGQRITGTDKLDAHTSGNNNDGYGYYALTFSYHFGHTSLMKAPEQPKPQIIRDTVTIIDDSAAKEAAEKLRQEQERIERERAEQERLARIKDTDGDSIPDVEDLCPAEKGSRFNHGCPPKPVTPQETKFIQTLTIRFAPNEPAPMPQYTAKVDQLIEFIRTHENCTITIIGHTDNSGTLAANMKFSLKRAETMKTYLISQGVPENANIKTKGVGFSQPAASNATPQGRALNRRVTFKVTCPK